MEFDDYQDIKDSSVGVLKDFLSERGLAVSGCKAELTARVFCAWEQKIPKSVTDDDKLDILRRWYNQRLKAAKLQGDPLKSDVVWNSGIDCVPKTFDVGKIFAYRKM